MDLVILRVLCWWWLERRAEMLSNLFPIVFNCLHEMCGQQVCFPGYMVIIVHLIVEFGLCL